MNVSVNSRTKRDKVRPSPSGEAFSIVTLGVDMRWLVYLPWNRSVRARACFTKDGSCVL